MLQPRDDRAVANIERFVTLARVIAYVSDRGRRFQRDRRRCFTVIVDGRGCAQAAGFIVTQSSMMV